MGAAWDAAVMNNAPSDDLVRWLAEVGNSLPPDELCQLNAVLVKAMAEVRAARRVGRLPGVPFLRVVGRNTEPAAFPLAQRYRWSKQAQLRAHSVPVIETLPKVLHFGKVDSATMGTISHLPVPKRPGPTAKNGKVRPPRRRKNADRRSREHLTAREVDQLLAAARRSGRYGHRDETLVLTMFRHALRVSEAVALRWDQVDLEAGLLHVVRVKNGTPSTHPLRGVELRALRRLRRNWPESPYVFASERGAAMTSSNVRKLIGRLGQAATLPFSVHPHMLRHACGFKLANDEQDTRSIQHYMGHKNIMHTVRYTELAPERFKDFFSD